MSQVPFVLLDDCTATAEMPRSRLYRDFVREIVCKEPWELAAAEEALQKDLAQGFYAVLLCDYEFGMGLVSLDACGREGFLRFLIFRCVERLSSVGVEKWLVQTAVGKGGFIDLEPNVDRNGFDQAVATIRDQIRQGETCQVNYTFRLKFKAFGEPLVLYRKLRERQPAVYGAVAVLPGGKWILSFSPELFVRFAEGRLVSGPIKGTLARSGEIEEDRRRTAVLAADEKSQAENLMIVDLLRNDLGRIARVGSVTVPALFQVEEFGQMLQMVSTIEAELEPKSALADIIAALFPCGSITGAPKRRTMEIIQELEPDQRGIYTGAIGWIDPPKDLKVGDFCFSVAIRTLELEPSDLGGLYPGVMGVGAGILYDSDPALEYAECELKSRFLTGLDPGFELFETMYAERESGCRHLARHLARLHASAERFDFLWIEDQIRQAIDKAIASLPKKPHRLRLSLSRSGKIKVVSEPITLLREKVEVDLAAEPIYSENLFLRHKTTVRSTYDKILATAAELGVFDFLFFNERGELCEGARSNVFLKLAESWFTPPLSVGLLPGVMRSVLLEDSTLGARERVLRLDDILTADAIFVCNALHGRVECTVRSYPSVQVQG